LATVTGEVDLSTHDGQLIARIHGAVARKESDDKSRRIQRKHQELAHAGRPSGGGSRPFGYEDAARRAVRPAEAAIIRECTRRVLAGDSLRSISSDLNRDGLLSATGKQWSPTTLRRILISGAISGQREHHCEIVAKAAWEPIITPAETQRLRLKLNDPDRRTNRSARRYLLARLLRCAHCGSRLYSRPRADGSRRYVCASGPGFGGCGKLTIMAVPLEQFVVEAVLHRLDSPELPKALNGSATDPEGSEWQQEIERTQAKLDELAALWAEGAIRRSEWLTARAPIEKRLDLAKKRLATLNRTSALTPHVGEGTELQGRWAEMTLSRQQQIVAALLEHVVVGPARRGFNRFDPTRLHPVWRY
jgi:hypothetical protein